VIALDSAQVETPEAITEHLSRALAHKRPDELVAAPDCGMKYLARDAAFAKLEAMVGGARAASEAQPVETG
jgi:5-methyltetrahydropteroyltriglutamate--homocysteine methyltransferase